MQKFCLTILSFVVVLAMVGSANADRGRGSRGDGNDKGLECRARLSGDQEVPPVTTITTGRFRIEFNENETAAKFELKVNDGERVRQAHIHCAPAGVNGAIVAFLAGLHNPGWDVDGRWIDNATLTDVNIMAPNAACPNSIANLRDLAQAGRDGNLYANVHTTANPSGVARGQLECKDED